METSELIANLEATLAELRLRLDQYVGRADQDIVAADEGFALAGIVYASAREAEKHASNIRELLQGSREPNRG